MVLNDNVGFLLASIFTPQIAKSATKNQAGFVDQSGTPRTLRIYSPHLDGFGFNGGLKAQTQVGQGTTPPTRTDLTIQTPFTNAPESGLVDSAGAGYNAGLGKIQVPTQITPLGGGGTIQEVVSVNTMTIANNQTRTFLFTRKLVSSTNFSIGQTLNIDWEFTI